MFSCLQILEACGISTLSQSPMLGFHKQMDNRIKLLEEILSFRMQGVEFDNGDMYVDGHNAASDVRDEFVSVTEKLMDELAQRYNVLPQLDITNTIDHRPEGDEKWFLENEKTVTQFCRKLAAERPLNDIRDEYNYPKKKGIQDECSRLLEAFFFQAEDGIRDLYVTGVQTCALPISPPDRRALGPGAPADRPGRGR